MTPRHRILCAKLPDGHLKLECSVLHSNVDFFIYFKFEEYSIWFFDSPSAVTYTGYDVLVRGIELRC